MVLASTSMKFTKADIGKKVIANENAAKKRGYNITVPGWIGTIVEVDCNKKDSLRVIGKSISSSFGLNVDPYYFDFVEESKELTKFNVGDRVISTYSSTRGEVGTVVGFNKNLSGEQTYYVDGFSCGCPVVYNGKNVNEYSGGFLEPSEVNTSPVWSQVHTADTLDRMIGVNDIIYTRCGSETMYLTGDGLSLFNMSHGDIIKSNNYKTMNIIDKIRVNIKGEPMKTLIKNEILTLDERLTNTGKELFMDFLYTKFKDEFVADLAPKLEGLNDDK